MAFPLLGAGTSGPSSAAIMARPTAVANSGFLTPSATPSQPCGIPILMAASRMSLAKISMSRILAPPPVRMIPSGRRWSYLAALRRLRISVNKSSRRALTTASTSLRSKLRSLPFLATLMTGFLSSVLKVAVMKRVLISSARSGSMARTMARSLVILCEPAGITLTYWRSPSS